jgi:hypothetical protein
MTQKQQKPEALLRKVKQGLVFKSSKESLETLVEAALPEETSKPDRMQICRLVAMFNLNEVQITTQLEGQQVILEKITKLLKLSSEGEANG